MVRTAGSGARPVWATDYDDEEEEDLEEVVSEDEYRPSKAVKYAGLVHLLTLYTKVQEKE